MCVRVRVRGLVCGTRMVQVESLCSSDAQVKALHTFVAQSATEMQVSRLLDRLSSHSRGLQTLVAALVLLVVSRCKQPAPKMYSLGALLFELEL